MIDRFARFQIGQTEILAYITCIINCCVKNNIARQNSKRQYTLVNWHRFTLFKSNVGPLPYVNG